MILAQHLVCTDYTIVAMQLVAAASAMYKLHKKRKSTERANNHIDQFKANMRVRFLYVQLSIHRENIGIEHNNTECCE